MLVSSTTTSPAIHSTQLLYTRLIFSMHDFMLLYVPLAFTLIGLTRSASSGLCQPFHSSFPPSSVSSGNSPFVAVSPQGSYGITENGLELYLRKPQGPVKTHDGVNDKIADGATINSTFALS